MEFDVPTSLEAPAGIPSEVPVDAPSAPSVDMFASDAAAPTQPVLPPAPEVKPAPRLESVPLDFTQDASPQTPVLPSSVPSKGATDGSVGSLSAKYESNGDWGMGHKDNIGWAYGRFQFNSRGSLNEFFAQNPKFKSLFEGVHPETNAFVQRWRQVHQQYGTEFEQAQTSTMLSRSKPVIDDAAGLGFKTDNRGVQEAIISGTAQHGGVRKIVAEAARTPGFASMTPQDQLKAFYDARVRYVSHLGTLDGPLKGALAGRYKQEYQDALAYAGGTAAPLEAPPAPKGTTFGTTIKPADIQSPYPSIPEATIQAANEQRANYNENHSTIIEAARSANLTVRAAESYSERFAPNPDFEMVPALQAHLMKQYGLPEEFRSSLGGAVSMKHAEFLAEQAQGQMQREEFLASKGLAGVGATLLAATLDPVAMGAAAATAGVADIGVVAAGLGRTSRVVAQAAAGAGTNVALEQVARGFGDVHAGKNLGLAVATGALFGSAYGLIARNPLTLAEAAMQRNAAKTLHRALEDTTALTDPAAARSMGAAGNPNADIPFINDKSVAALQDANVPTTAFANKMFGFIPLRFSAAGLAKSSKNALTRLAAGIGLDGVGWADKSVNQHSAAEVADLMFRTSVSKLNNVWHPAATEWAAEQGYRFAGKTRGGSEFNEEVYRYVINRNSSVEFHPAVQRVGEHIRKLNAEILSLAKNPGERSGLISRAVQGFADVKENRHYMTRIFAGEKVNAARAAYGDEGLMAWTRGAIAKAQPDLDKDEVEKLAGYYVKRIALHANRVDERLNLAMSGFDREQLKEVFREAGLDDDRINGLLNSVKKDSKTGADARAKHRMFLDENFRLENYPKKDGSLGSISLQDMTVTDAMMLSTMYAKHMYGRIALADFKIRNPKTGELIADGITSDNEWTALKNRIADYAMERLPKHEVAAAVEKDHANLDYMYNQILGRPDKDAVGDAANWLRRFGDVNYLRLGGNFGMAQIPETVAPIAHLGVKAALSVMPAFRRFINGEGSRELKDEMARTVEAMWGLGADASRGFQYFRHEDTGAIEGAHSALDNGLNLAKRGVSHASALSVVNAALQRWTGKAIIQKFSDIAQKAFKETAGEIDLSRLKAADLDRMKSLGLSDDMLKRVLKEMRDNTTLEDGMLFKHKVTRINMDGWKDQEARANFEMAGFRWARKIIQENDVGTMHRWMAKPLARMMMQFRMFPLVAWDKQLLHNIHMRDMTSFNLAWMSMAAGSATYALQSHIASVGRSDADQFLSRRLSMKNLALGGFQRSGFSSLLPMMADTGSYVMGGSPLFDFRMTGQPSDAIFGNPTMSMIDDLSRATKGAFQPFLDGRERSQQEWRNIHRTLPLATWLPATSLLSTMVSGSPLQPPKTSR